MVKARSRNRIVLHLNPRIALEAIILNRIESIPQTRRQEWLRGLLVQGFRVECQVLREGSVDTHKKSGAKFADWLSDDSKIQAALSVPKPEQKPGQTRESSAHTASKPFAQLSRIIG